MTRGKGRPIHHLAHPSSSSSSPPPPSPPSLSSSINAGPGSTDKDAASVRSDRPAPLTCGVYYWEVAILARGRDGFIGVGLAGPDVKLERLPGWDAGSYGYHGDDGHAFRGSGAGRPYGPTFGAGDVVGVLLNRAERTISFSKNGVDLGVAFVDVPADQPLHPSVGMRTPDEEVEGNFGGSPWRGADVVALVAGAAARAAGRVLGVASAPGPAADAAPPVPFWAAFGPGSPPPPLAALAAAAAAAGGADRASATAAALALDYCRHVGATRAAAALAAALAAAASGPPLGGGGGGAADASSALPASKVPASASAHIAAALTAAAAEAADPSAGPRAAVRAALESGQVAAARAASEAAAPGALAAVPAVSFALDVQAFVELVRAGDDGAAMAYGRAVLGRALATAAAVGQTTATAAARAPSPPLRWEEGAQPGAPHPLPPPPHPPQPATMDRASRELLEDALSLLAYADPAASPCGRLLSEGARAALADRVDAALRSAVGLPPAPALEVALRQAGAVWAALRAQGDADAALVSPNGMLGLSGG